MRNPPQSFIAVFCGSSIGVRESYAIAARETAAICSQLGLGIVFGGSDVGLMGELARSALLQHCPIVGVTLNDLAKFEPPVEGLTELVLVETLHQRKQIMSDRADAILVLPGGIGSLDEAFEALTWKQVGLHHKRIIFVDIDGYWQPLKQLIAHMQREGFVSPDGADSIEYSSSVANAMILLESGREGRTPAREGLLDFEIDSA